MAMMYTTRVIGLITPYNVCDLYVLAHTGFCPYEGTIAVISGMHFIDMHSTQAETG